MKNSILFQLLFILVITACNESNDAPEQPHSPPSELSSAPKPARDVIAELSKYASDLALNTKNNLFDPSTKTSADSGYSYVIKFQTNDKKLMLEDVDKDPSAYNRNITRTAAWGVKFCTPELKKLIDEFKLNYVYGMIINSKTEDTQSISMCKSDSSPTIEDNLKSIERSLDGLDKLKGRRYD